MNAWFLLAALAVLPMEDPAVKLKTGDAAPKFEALDDTGKPWKSSDHVGKKVVVVYFYPASFTGGCTKQACTFEEDFKALTDAGIEVVGVSGDAVKTQEMFKKAHKLEFTLLADEKGAVAKAFGVPTEAGGDITQKIDGKDEKLTRGVTISRWTFVIDKSGKIAYVNQKVNPSEDSKNVLEVVKKLHA